MLMRYHWGLGIGHMYSHMTAPVQSQVDSISQWSQPPQASTLDADEDEDSETTQTELNFDSEFESEGSEAGSESQSGLESVLGDHVDMYGCGSNPAAFGGYEF